MYLGLDCGTSGLKALLTDERGDPVASASRSYSPARPRPGWSEQNPDDWLAAMTAAVADVKQSAGKALGALKAIGFSGQMHGAVLLGADDRPVRPAILHNDRARMPRRKRWRPTIQSLATRRRRKADGGSHGAEALWLPRHEPRTIAAARCVLLPKDYLRFELTGEKGSST